MGVPNMDSMSVMLADVAGGKRVLLPPAPRGITRGFGAAVALSPRAVTRSTMADFILKRVEVKEVLENVIQGVENVASCLSFGDQE